MQTRRSGRWLRRVAVGVAALVLVALGPSAPADDETWRSELYPDDWTPATTAEDGRFLHDHSFAGFRLGERLPPRVVGPVVDAVAEHGADPTGLTDSTDAIQGAIDAAAGLGGGVVFLPEGVYRCDDLLTVTGNGVVVRGAGPGRTLLRFTRDHDMTDRAGLTIRGSVTRGPDLELAADGETRSVSVAVEDASSLAPGDDVAVGWVITDEFVAEHGMTGTWRAFNGSWRPFFRRTVTAIDTSSAPHVVTLDVPLRYPAKLRDGASLRREQEYVRECGVESLSVCNAVSRSAAWDHDRAHAVELRDVSDAWVRNVHSAPPPDDPEGDHLQSGGVLVVESRRVTVEGCSMRRAQHRGGGGNGYLFEVSRSGEVLFADCEASDGRHNFIQNWGFGTSGCVFLRCRSERSRAFFAEFDPFGLPAYCEFHHSLATANLIDSCHLEDGWYAGNRGDESTGAGQTSTECTFWNLAGGGLLRSFQFGHGYVVGPGDLTVLTTVGLPNSGGTAPEDTVERGPGDGVLEPASLHADQLARRVGVHSVDWTVKAGRLVDDRRPERDRLALVLRPDRRPERPFDARQDGLRLELTDGAWGHALEIPAADPGWRRRRGVWRWKSAKGVRPRVRVVVRRGTGRVALRVDRAEWGDEPAGTLDVGTDLGLLRGSTTAPGVTKAGRRHRVLRRDY